MSEHTPAPTPNRAVYGFAMYLCFKISFILYLIWVIIPETYFQYIGIKCLPKRYWAVAIPICIVTTVLIFGFIIYPSINLCMTPKLNDTRTVFDEIVKKSSNHKKLLIPDPNTKNCICKDTYKCGALEYLNDSDNTIEKCIPSAMDLDIIEVSELLYLKTKIV